MDISFLPREENDVTPLDILIAGNDIVAGDDIQTSVLMSLFSDQRATPQDNQDNPRGWWGDSLSGTKSGSRLWTLRGKKINSLSLSKAGSYAKASLDWMITDGLAKEVTAECTRKSLDIVELFVTITKPDNTTLNQKYDLTWERNFK